MQKQRLSERISRKCKVNLHFQTAIRARCKMKICKIEAEFSTHCLFRFEIQFKIYEKCKQFYISDLEQGIMKKNSVHGKEMKIQAARQGRQVSLKINFEFLNSESEIGPLLTHMDWSVDWYSPLIPHAAQVHTISAGGKHNVSPCHFYNPKGIVQ